MNTFDVGRKQLTDKPIIPVVDTRYLKQILVIVLGLVLIIMIVLMNHACPHISCHCNPSCPSYLILVYLHRGYHRI